jgi:hypothetical protein
MYMFAFKNRFVDQKGNPLMFAGAILDTAFSPKALERQSSPDWHKPVFSVHYKPEEALSFPDELWLNTGERRLAFDFRLDMHGLIISERFLGACGESFKKHFKLARLNIVNRKGENISDRSMFYAKPLAPRAVVDEQRSERAMGEVDVGQFRIQERIFSRVSFKSDMTEDYIYPADIDGCIIIKEHLGQTLSNAELIGVELVGEAQFVERYNCRNVPIRLAGTQ